MQEAKAMNDDFFLLRFPPRQRGRTVANHGDFALQGLLLSPSAGSRGRASTLPGSATVAQCAPGPEADNAVRHEPTAALVFPDTRLSGTTEHPIGLERPPLPGNEGSL